WTSEPLATSGTIYPEAVVTAGWWESSGAANLRPFCTIAVTQGESATVRRGSSVSHLHTEELPTAQEAVSFVATVGGSGAVDFEPGDRIFVQLGYKPENGSSTSYSGTISFGGTAGDDLDEGDSGTALQRPAWIDLKLSEGVEFAPPIAGAPAEEFDLTKWKITLPTEDPEDPGDADEVTQPELDELANEHFYLDPAGRMVFVAPTSGDVETTGGSSSTRSELREMVDDGANEAAWSVYDSQPHSLTVSGYFDPTSITGGEEPRQEMIVGQ